MKLKLILSILLLKFSFAFAQEPEIPKGAVKIDESTVIKDTLGNVIPFSQFIGLMNSGEWTAEPKFNDRGELNFLQLRKATEEDKKMMAGMRSGPNESARIGEALPAFTLTDIAGNEYNSEKLLGKVIVLNLWFTACKPCIMEMPELNRLHKKYENNPKVVFLSITYNSKKELKKFLKKHDFDYPVVPSAQETCSALKVNGYPTNIIVDQTGKFAFFATGSFPGIGDVIDLELQKQLAK